MGILAVDSLVMAVAGTLWLLFLGRVVAGIFSATQSTASAFMADISKPEEKAANFGLVGAAFGVGFVFGPLIGGLLGELGPRAPFYAAAILAAGNAIFGYFVLPETVTDKIRRPFDWRRANPFGALKVLGKMPEVGRLLFLFFLYEFAFFVYPAIWAYFTAARFGWDTTMIGFSLASFGIAMALVQGVLIRVILARLGDQGTVLYGFAFNAMAFLVLAFVWNGWVALIFTPVTALGAVVTPALQGMASRRVGDDQQGELQGAITSVRSVAVIFSPLAMTQIFATFTSGDGPYLPGAPFLLSMALMGVCATVFLTRRRIQAS